MKIEVLGSGCPKCKKLEESVRRVVAGMGVDADITHIYDVDKILAYDVFLTPALVVDGVVKVSGKLPSEDELEKLLLQS